MFVFALRRDENHVACESLLFDRLDELHVHLPFQILVELQGNLTDAEMRGLWRILARAPDVTWDYQPAPLEGIARWQQQGAKKGDAVVVAHLEAARIDGFISENRHFLAEITALPFEVLTSEQAIRRLNETDVSV